MCCKQDHRLHQGVHDKALASIFWITKLQRIAELRNTVLHLNPRVHLHEEVTICVNDALEGRDRIQSNRSAESRGFLFHRIQRDYVSFQHLCFGGQPRRGDLFRRFE